MYGARDYLAYLGYGAMRLFQDDIIRGISWQLLATKQKIYRSLIAINIARSLSLNPVSYTHLTLPHATYQPF